MKCKFLHQKYIKIYNLNCNLLFVSYRFKNGKQLDESDRVKYIRDEKAEIYSLEIKSVVLEDDATYSYKAKNDVGEASGKALVKIHSKFSLVLFFILIYKKSICH